jgi:tetratricopeptide (TPR) repeat protein
MDKISSNLEKFDGKEPERSKLDRWIERITSESNLWLNAIKMEDNGNYLEAFHLYLKDASEWLKKESLIRAALSCSCAANCLSKTGNLVATRQLYLQAAVIYEENANIIMSRSVREALWSYQEAYEYFYLALESEEAERIFEKYVSLARKINRFSGEQDAMNSLRQRRISLEHSKIDINSTNMQISAQVESAIESFLSSMKSVTHYNNKKDTKFGYKRELETALHTTSMVEGKETSHEKITTD